MHASDCNAQVAPAFRIAGEMNIYRAGELRQALREAFAHSERCEFDLSDVSEIDTSGVQLIVAARKSASDAGKVFRIVAASAAVTDALELLGLAACLGAVSCARCVDGNQCPAMVGA